jgi:hypothetical protein
MDGSTRDGDGPGREPEDPADAALSPVERWQKAVCTVNRSCCGTDPDVLTQLQDCETNLEARYSLLSSFNNGKVTVDPQKLATCLAAAKTATCAAAIPDFAPCRGVLNGTVADGGECRSTFECARGPAGDPAVCVKGEKLEDDLVRPTPTGVCRPSPLAQIGQPCSITVNADAEEFDLTSRSPVEASFTLPRCSRARGLACEDGNRCTPLGAAGDGCSELQRCAIGLVCACGRCEEDRAVSLAGLPLCVDGVCRDQCGSPAWPPRRDDCDPVYAPGEDVCRAPAYACGDNRDCPQNWDVAQSPNGCKGHDATVVLGACGDTKTWHRPGPADLTCYYDAKSGRVVGVKTVIPDFFCSGAPPSEEGAFLLAGHVPATCPDDSSGARLACNTRCDAGATP